MPRDLFADRPRLFRERLVQTGGLLVMALVIGMTLYLVFPRTAHFEDADYVAQPDAVSIAYLNVLLRSDPKNKALRLTLAKQLRQTGQHHRASLVLSDVAMDEAYRYRPDVAEELLALLAHEYFSATDEAIKAQHYAALNGYVSALVERIDGWSALQALASQVQSWLTLESRIDLARRGLTLAPSDQERQSLLVQLANLEWQRGAPAEAARLFWQAHAMTLDADERRALASRALQAATQSGHPATALQMARAVVNRYPQDQAFIRQARDMALQNADLPQAILWTRRLIARETHNSPDSEQLLVWLIGQGELAEARALADQQLQRGAMTVDNRRRIAQLYEWQGVPAKALAQWQQVLGAGGEAYPLALERVFALTKGLYDWPALIALLEAQKKRNGLTQAQTEALLQAYVEVGNPEAAIAYLRHLLQARPAHAQYLQAIIQLAVDTRQSGLLLTYLAQKQGVSGLTAREWKLKADTLNRTGRPEQALKALQEGVASASLDAAELYEPLLRQALYLEDATATGQALAGWLDGPQTLPADLAAAALQLLEGYGAHEQAQRVANALWQQDQDFTRLLAAMRVAVSRKDWTLARELGDKPVTIPVSQAGASYWEYRAFVAEQEGRLQDASQAYQQALEIEPERVSAIAALVWSFSAEEGFDAAELDELLNRYEPLAHRESSLWGAWAFGHTRLYAYSQALYWYRRGLPMHADDWRWLTSYAAALEEAGDKAQARALRYQALGKLSTWYARQSAPALTSAPGLAYLRLVR